MVTIGFIILLLNSMYLRILKGAGLSNATFFSLFLLHKIDLHNLNPSEFLHTTSDFRNGLVRHPLGICVRKFSFPFCYIDQGIVEFVMK